VVPLSTITPLPKLYEFSLMPIEEVGEDRSLLWRPMRMSNKRTYMLHMYRTSNIKGKTANARKHTI